MSRSLDDNTPHHNVLASPEGPLLQTRPLYSGILLTAPSCCSVSCGPAPVYLLSQLVQILSKATSKTATSRPESTLTHGGPTSRAALATLVSLSLYCSWYSLGLGSSAVTQRPRDFQASPLSYSTGAFPTPRNLSIWQSKATTQTVPVAIAGHVSASYFTAASLSYTAAISGSPCRAATILANPTVPQLYFLRATFTHDIIFPYHLSNSHIQTPILGLSASDQTTTMPYVMNSTLAAISPL